MHSGHNIDERIVYEQQYGDGDAFGCPDPLSVDFSYKSQNLEIQNNGSARPLTTLFADISWNSQNEEQMKEIRLSPYHRAQANLISNSTNQGSYLLPWLALQQMKGMKTPHSDVFMDEESSENSLYPTVRFLIAFENKFLDKSKFTLSFEL